jgi:hypothetical protein
VKDASDYHRHAQECRALAARMKTGDQRQQLLRIAATWERLAEGRSDPARKRSGQEQARDEKGD